MLQVISNISSIITAVTFIVYLVGRFIRISFSKYNTHERFTVFKREKSGRNIDEETNFLEITSIGVTSLSLKRRISAPGTVNYDMYKVIASSMQFIRKVLGDHI